MVQIPEKLDEAKLICYALKPEPLDFGFVSFDDGRHIAIKILAIAQYEDSTEYYLFACDSTWWVMGDTVHESLETAKDFAQTSYREPNPIHWQNVH